MSADGIEPVYLLLALIVVTGAGFFARQWLKRRRIRAIYATPLPAETIHLLHRHVPLYRRLPEQLKAKLHGHVNFFLHDKTFIGCNGQEITDEVRATIAGNACMLVINRQQRIFPGFTSILVYPDTFVSPVTTRDGLVETTGYSARLGESWHRGPVVLSWSNIRLDTENPDDGHNVILHEFAHKLDEENSLMDGLPVLRSRQQYEDWASVLTDEFERFRQRVNEHRNRVIDEYGVVSPAEFFAVISETFFEKPGQMKHVLPDLYDQLRDFYQMDPEEWNATLL